LKSKLLILLLLLSALTSFSQNKKIKIIHSDNTFKDAKKYPNAIVALGNVMVEHEGATLACKQALIYQEANIMKAFGEVFINQGDSVTQSSKYVHYDGNTKIAKSWGNVVLTDPKMTLTTDTLLFDRTKQLLYYEHHATIKDSTSTLKSEVGNYFLNENKFQALSEVIITSPDSKVTSNHLDYYTDTGISNLYGPSLIEDIDNTLYCEKGHHNSKTNISHFTKNAKITYKDRIIEGDSMYYDKKRHFASSTGNIVVTDTINNSIIKGGYAEYFEKLDSVFVVKKALAISLVEKDSMYVHGDTLLVTGKQDHRIMRAYHHVKFFKKDLQGKCDSLHTNEALGITKMYRRPVLWNKQNQITGDSIYFTSNTTTQKMDSLKVYDNAFVISKDSIEGFNQIKGKYLYGKFINDELDNILVKGNAEVVFYIREEEKEMKLMGIMKMACSEITFKMLHGDLEEAIFKVEPEGKTYPKSKFPKPEEKLKGFLWREKEHPLTKEAIFIHDKGDDALIKEVIKKEITAKKETREEAKKAAKNLLKKTKIDADIKKEETQKNLKE